MPCFTHATPVRPGTTLREIAGDGDEVGEVDGVINGFKLAGKGATRAAAAPAQNAQGHAL
jgi:hypothetical protein